MNRIIEADESSTIRLEGDALGVRPHARYSVEREGQNLILRPIEIENATAFAKQSFLWEVLSPDERVKEFLQWARRQPPSDVHLTDEQLRRENLYD